MFRFFGFPFAACLDLLVFLLLLGRGKKSRTGKKLILYGLGINKYERGCWLSGQKR